jgi:tight adherence protein C
MTIPAAIERIGNRGSGVLASECRLIATEIELGVSTADALHASERRVGHDGWGRLVEHLTAARRHGTPLAEIVRALADDEAAAAGRRLVESASTRETMMMFPLVFGILPATVLIAVYPGVTAIGLLV